jgi:archaeal flagellar protein FlaJ
VDAWNMSLSEAARFIAKRTPSEIFADFLDRFAYALESGEDLEDFLKSEQVVVINDYGAHYKGNLYELENMKNLFNSMMMSVIFIVIFALLMPILTGISATILLGGALFLVGFIEVIFLYFTKAKAPSDPMWHNLKFETHLDKVLKRTLPISLLLCVGVVLAVLHFTEWPMLILMACGLTPLLLVNWHVAREEDRLKRRDDNFAAFIRSLGASTSARGGQVTEVLRHLQTHDFGPLTENVQDLYSRLNVRVDDTQAWRYFAADCGSNLIEKFSRMFLEGLKAGGKPAPIGRIISDNFVEITNLRKGRYQTASSFRGLLYGLMAGMAFALYVGLGIVDMLENIFNDMDMPEGTPFMEFFHFSSDSVLTNFLVMALLLGHAVTSALMVKIADGGNYFRSYGDLVGMFWVAAIVGVGAGRAIEYLL